MIDLPLQFLHFGEGGQMRLSPSLLQRVSAGNRIVDGFIAYYAAGWNWAEYEGKWYLTPGKVDRMKVEWYLVIPFGWSMLNSSLSVPFEEHQLWMTLPYSATCSGVPPYSSDLHWLHKALNTADCDSRVQVPFRRLGVTKYAAAFSKFAQLSIADFCTSMCKLILESYMIHGGRN